MSLSSRLVRLTAGAVAFAAAIGSAQNAPDLVPVPELGVRLQRGFRMSLYADGDLAGDIQAMTLDAQGRVVVTGPGYIKTLHDTQGRGRADRATVFATPAGGGMGMCFDGATLYFSGNGWLSRYEDLDGDGVADRPAENLFPLGASERGGHALRKGPDGNLYLIGGNASGFTSRHTTLPSSPVREIEAGALLRLAPDGSSSEVIAHGFYNPYSFDFDVAGEMSTFDGDVESDLFLPWYTPARFYHIGYGGHHGWRLNSGKRSWARPDYYADTVNVLAFHGRGAPTGLVCYRHLQFPARYRGGLFALDWAFGGIFFVPLQPDGASYQARPELFLEPLGVQGFTPTDICVATNGSVFVAIGGRKTRSAVFRIDYAGPPLVDPITLPTLNPEINFVLQGPQPLDAWSRAIWVPAARRLGAAPFLRLAGDPDIDPVWRVRAIEIVTELFGGLPPAAADAAASAGSPLVRARTAWSLGRIPGPNPSLTLFPLLADAHPLVRRCALDAVADHMERMDSPELLRLLTPNLGHSDKRVRQAATRAASLLSDASWQNFTNNLAQAEPGTQLSGLLAQIWRVPGGGHPEVLAPLAAILEQAKDSQLRLDTVRLIILALGDWNLNNPSLELYTGCEAAALPVKQEPMLNRLRLLTRSLLPSGNADLDVEAARLLAMLQDNDPRAARLVLSLVTPKSEAADDFHALVCFARMRAWPAGLTPRVAHALLNLDLKLHGLGQHPKQNWPAREIELTQELLRREPKLAAALFAHPRFAAPEHVGLAAQLGPQHQPAVARLYLAAVRQDTNFPWSGPLIELLSLLPPAEVRPLLRTQWNNLLLRDEILLQLAAKPEAVDRDRFWQGLSGGRETARASVAALAQLPRDAARTNLLAPFALLHRLQDEPKEAGLRTEVLALIARETGQAFDIKEPPVPEQPTLAHAAALQTTYQPVFAWLAKTHPKAFETLNLKTEDDPVKWRALLKATPWAKGDPTRGERIASDRGCLLCHVGPPRLGPDLGGITRRLSVEDLFNAIVFPSRVISEPYRPTAFLMRDGQTVAGLVLHESSGGVLVQTTATTTDRLDDANIVSQQPGRFSFMPPGLLDDLKPEDIADLYSFLKTLPPRK